MSSSHCRLGIPVYRHEGKAHAPVVLAGNHIGCRTASNRSFWSSLISVRTGDEKTIGRGRAVPWGRLGLAFALEGSSSRPLGDPQRMRLECRGIDLPASDPRGRTASPIDAEAFFVELDHLITVPRSVSEDTCSVEHRQRATAAGDICRSTPAALAPVRVLLSRQIFLPKFSRQLQVRKIVDQIKHGLPLS